MRGSRIGKDDIACLDIKNIMRLSSVNCGLSRAEVERKSREEENDGFIGLEEYEDENNLSIVTDNDYNIGFQPLSASELYELLRGIGREVKQVKQMNLIIRRLRKVIVESYYLNTRDQKKVDRWKQ